LGQAVDARLLARHGLAHGGGRKALELVAQRGSAAIIALLGSPDPLAC
jgi:hypothetical protein